MPGAAAFDIIIAGSHRSGSRVTLNPSQWRQPLPDRVPVSVERDGRLQVVGTGGPHIDRKGNLRIRGVWATTPLAEHVRTLVAQGKLRNALLQYIDTIDDAGHIVREVLGGVFILPTDPPPAPVGDAGGAEPAAQLLGLAARIYATNEPRERAALADRVIACAVKLGGSPAPTPAAQVYTHGSGDALQHAAARRAERRRAGDSSRESRVL